MVAPAGRQQAPTSCARSSLILKTMGALLYAGDDAVRARMLVPTPARAGLVTLRTKRVQAA